MNTILNGTDTKSFWDMTAENVYADPKEIQIALDFQHRRIVMHFLLRFQVESTLSGDFESARKITDIIDVLVPETKGA